jgi:hypothetical protein
VSKFSFEFRVCLGKFVGAVSRKHHHELELLGDTFVADNPFQPRKHFNCQIFIRQHLLSILESNVNPVSVLFGYSVNLLLEAAQATAEIGYLWGLRTDYTAQLVQVY